MSTNCIVCVENERTGLDLLCDRCQLIQTLEKAAADEKRRRIYYQDIVYNVCNTLDYLAGNTASNGARIVCGTADSPATGVQDAMCVLKKKILVHVPRRVLEQHAE